MSKRGNGDGTLYQKKPGGPWYMGLKVEGRRVQRSTGTKNKTEAKEILRAALNARDENRATDADSRLLGEVTFQVLEDRILEDYATKGNTSTRRLQTSLMHLRDHLGGLTLPGITSARIRRYVQDRLQEVSQKTGESPSRGSINLELAALGRAMNLVAEDLTGYTVPTIRKLPLTGEHSNVREGFVTVEEMKSLAAHLPAWLSPLVRFAFWTGFRRGEVSGMKWRDVNLGEGTVTVSGTRTKNKKAKVVSLRSLPWLLEILQAQDAGNVDGSEYVFYRPTGRPAGDFRKVWATATDAAGLPGLLFHDLRRSAVYAMERAGIPRTTAMNLTGHQSEAVYLRYSITDEAAQDADLEKLAAWRGGKTEAKVTPIRRTA